MRDGNVWLANADGSGQRQVTTDGATIPYVFVSTGKVGAAPLLAFQRYSASTRPLYGTLKPDATGYAISPYNTVMSATNVVTPSPALNVVGDRLAYSVGASDCGVVGQGCVQYYVPESVGVDGSRPALINSVRGALDVTFGDPTGATLLFDDPAFQYLPPTACTTTSMMLVRQAPQPVMTNPPLLGPAAFYCVTGTDLVQPALRPDGQTIAAIAQDGHTSRIVTVPISGVAVGAVSSPITPVTPANLPATRPDFSPDGTQIVFQGPGRTVYTVPAGGGAPTAILTNASVPAWSPYTQPASEGGAGGGGTGGGASIGSGGPGKPLSPPAISDARLMSTRFAVARQGTAISARARRGTTIRLTLSAIAALSIAITRTGSGVQRGQRCAPMPTHRGRQRLKRCKRTITVGTLTRSREPQGPDSIPFSGRIGHHALSPHDYKAVITARNQTGTSTPVNLPFTIVQ